MFILKDKAMLSKAIEKAKIVRPKVKIVAFGIYFVTGSRGCFHTVQCSKRNGKKFVDCDCHAGRCGMVCFHSAAALPVHVHMAATRRTA